MSLVRIIDIVWLGLLLVLALYLVLVTWKSLRIYAGIGTRRLEDASAFAPAAPPAAAALALDLATLGFSRIGERTLVLPGVGRRFEYDLVDEPTTTYVATDASPGIRGGVYMVCYSAFADGAFVETSFPGGPTIRRPDLYAAPGLSSPAETVTEHRRRVAEFSTRHGAPLPNRSMADLLVRDDTYRRKHGGITLRRRVYTRAALTGLVLLAAAIQLSRVVEPGP